MTLFIFPSDLGSDLGSQSLIFAWIPVMEAISPSSILSVFSISRMESEKNDGVIYDLMGRKINKPTKGIYILNGKKFFVK